MKVLYFIDPFLSAAQPEAACATFRFHVNNLHRMLQPSIEEKALEFVVLADEQLRLKVGRDLQENVVPTASIRLQDLTSGFASVTEARREWLAGQVPANAIERLRDAVLQALGEFGEPDVVIASESPATAMRLAFPDALVLSESWGIFSRQPFPLVVSYDPSGLYGSSTLACHAADIKAAAVDATMRAAFDRLRSRMAEALAENDPVGPHIAHFRPEFERILLFPIGPDSGYALSHATQFESHTAALEDTLARVPLDVGVLVLPDLDRTVPLDHDELAFLRQRFPNLLHLPALDRIPMAASFALQHVDGVIAISSNVAFQAALFRLPVFAIGRSQVETIACGGIDDIAELLPTAPVIDRDNVLGWILTHVQVFIEVEQIVGSNFLALLRELHGKRHLYGLDRFKDERLSTERLAEFLDKYQLAPALPGILRGAGVVGAADPVLVGIARARAVSFDLFDTLVTRPFVEPHFLFYALEQRVRKLLGNTHFRFMYWRRLAEEDARRNNAHREVTLDAIYREFGSLTGLGADACDLIAAEEFAAELRMISRRQHYVRSMDWARRLGRVVSIITDIYLDAAQIRELLDRVKISGFDYLYVSGESDIRKHDGSVFEHYLASLFYDHRITPRDGILHIGDNEHADGAMARAHGLTTVIVPRAIDRLRASRYGSALAANFEKRHAISDYLAGLLANRFDETLAKPSPNLFGGSWFRAGYAAAGPMLLAYVQWVIREARAGRITKLCFVARDGYVLKEIYDRIRAAGVYRDLPPSAYLHLSRRASAVAALSSTDDILELLHLPFGTRRLSDLLEYRFGMTRERVPNEIVRAAGFRLAAPVSDTSDLGRLKKLLEALAPAILENAADERAALLRYLGDQGVLDDGERCALVDIGYSGSIQRAVEKMVGRSLRGFYMLTHDAARWTFDDGNVAAFFTDWDEPRMADCHPLNDHVFLFETVLSSCEASLKRHRYGADGRWTMETFPSDREPQRLSFMERIHAGVLAFADDFLGRAGVCFDDLPLGPYLGAKLFFDLAHRPTPADARLFAGLKVENSFGGGDTWLLCATPPNAARMTPHVREIVIGKSQWKEAAHVLYRVEAADRPKPPAKPPNGAASPPPAKPRKNGPPASNGYNGHAPAPSANGAASPPPNGHEQPAALNGHPPINGANGHGTLPARLKGIEVPQTIRKYAKFRSDPYRFFADSRHPVVRAMRVFYRVHR